LQVNPTPAAAKVTVDDEPLADRPLRPGRHLVRVAADGYASKEVTVFLWPWQQLAEAAALEPALPLRDSVIGRGSNETKPAEDGRGAERRVENVVHRPRTGYLDLQVEPTGASLTLDGVGVPAGRSESLGLGEHTVAGELAGYERQEKKFLVAAGKTTPAHLVLPRLTCEMSCSGNALNLDNRARQYIVRLMPGTTKGRKAEFGLFVRRPGSDGRLWDLTTTGAGVEATIPGGSQLYICSKDPRAGGGCSGGCVAASPSASLTVDNATAALAVTCR
jgi:hypothetical protein